jgi:hypothetical protein
MVGFIGRDCKQNGSLFRLRPSDFFPVLYDSARQQRLACAETSLAAELSGPLFVICSGVCWVRFIAAL